MIIMHNKIPAQRQPLIDCFLERNSKINLSAIRKPHAVYTQHILDSLELQNAPSNPIKQWMRIADIGTGGWFPLLPLAITYPENTFIGIDARKKKMTAVSAIIEELWLSNCSTLRSRIENHKQRYDIVTARAVAYADQLMAWAVPKTTKWGYLILRKQFTFEEDADIRIGANKHKLTLLWRHQYVLPDSEKQRAIYCLRR